MSYLYMMSTRVGDLAQRGHMVSLKAMHELKIKIYGEIMKTLAGSMLHCICL